MSGLLNDKTIFLTGGSAGIGWECAKAYAREGAKVALCCPDADEAAAAAEKLGEAHIGLACDVANGHQVVEAIRSILERFGRLDAIHNNAGIASPAAALHDTSEAEWDRLFQINLKGVFWTVKHGLEALKTSRGSILNTSSLVGEIGQEIHAAYSATKGAMNALTKSMALDYARFGVRVNAVCPAGVWTPMLRQWASEQPDPSGISRYLDEIHPLGFCPEGDVVAEACVFLLSDKSGFITGHLMHITGGAELGYRR
jgi:NAD(P)-dependent dehydrogenase (short-subunit alcohol dehydrogenase family)